MKKVLFTSKVEEAMTFNSFGAATAFGNEQLGEGLFEISHKGGIRLILKHPANNGLLYVKE